MWKVSCQICKFVQPNSRSDFNVPAVSNKNFICGFYSKTHILNLIQHFLPRSWLSLAPGWDENLVRGWDFFGNTNKFEVLISLMSFSPVLPAFHHLLQTLVHSIPTCHLQMRRDWFRGFQGDPPPLPLVQQQPQQKLPLLGLLLRPKTSHKQYLNYLPFIRIFWNGKIPLLVGSN